MLSINPKEIPTAQLHGYMLGAVAPRPIAFASTIDEEGRPNLSPFSFFNVFSSNPPVMIVSPNRRVRNNTTKHTYENAKATKEMVINVVNYDIVQQMSLASTEYPEGVNEFEKAGLTMLKSEEVIPFRVAESPVQFECKVREIIELGNEGGSGNLILCEVVKVHVNEDILTSDGKIDQYKIDLVSRLGGNWYGRSREGLFEVPKPLSTMGIGVDQLPDHIRLSKVLTGNDLGKLGNIEALPTANEIEDFINSEIKLNGTLEEITEDELHRLSQKFLNNNDVLSAWKVLLAKK
ncbi:NADH-FMN oxidoreductase RutF, flavin reductase (DIM6/NTAB) family [Zhouia amylolytica]|uniref:NADH-FMN oxidoreductase RutF, flavin reductase (DIM6/NTAB) family n=1 Tax=Zhouia amylolytica TaxID=376730 RepID=A0A1I6SK54_9FLAO|nr:flavin reductase family protein [Zhouia amylolytica]SFS77323.1 NADH-FMN oxidoreductase RutF, flavin reductase (DIM6/NTAB) family [Zhouia amylolytica]